MDGSPHNMYWKESPTGSNEWLLFFQGGGGCLSEEECKARGNNMISSNNDAESV